MVGSFKHLGFYGCLAFSLGHNNYGLSSFLVLINNNFEGNTLRRQWSIRIGKTFVKTTLT